MDLDQIKKSAEEWLKMTLLNTIGRGLVSTVSKYSGVQEEKYPRQLIYEKCAF